MIYYVGVRSCDAVLYAMLDQIAVIAIYDDPRWVSFYLGKLLLAYIDHNG